MTTTYQTLFSEAFLRAVFDTQFQTFRGSAQENELLNRLGKWSSKSFQKETSAEGAFSHLFFEETWGYIPSGKNSHGEHYTFYPKYPIAGAGQGGGTGEADAALAIVGHKTIPATPQVLCEFKDVRSNLDAPQKRKGNNRSPVKQCADYLREAMKPLYGNEAVQPTWGIVTDMNEFRLYWRNTMPSQFQRFIIKKATTDEGVSLLEQSEAGSFQRFLFVKLFHRESLLSTGGPSALLKLIRTQGTQQKEIENTFYREYRKYREHLVDLLIEHNPSFSGTKGRLVRLTQKLIDRCIFVMFCEDMGEQLSFPPHALRDYLSNLSKSSTYDPDEQDAWNKLKELFQAMNEGKKFQSRPINKFNGGLFADDHDLHNLHIPNKAFCAKFQGESEADLLAHPLTLLYFAGSYNFGASTKERPAITLYTLGRIFEQSITELEALEAAKDDKQSITVISKRKRDGVYYTPEWVVERVVAETVGPRLDEIRSELGWDFDLEGDETEIAKQVARPPSDRSKRFTRHVEAVASFRERLDSFTVLDPACGSGAFLIHTLEYLLRERRRTSREFSLVTGGKGDELFSFKQDVEVRKILARNIFGVDINPASVEIAKLALWLHTANSDQPLSNLDSNIVEGNSLVSSEIFEFKKDLLSATQTKKETINAFDFEKSFPDVFSLAKAAGAGFDCIVGNPPYVKLQNFKKVYPETADFLRNAKGKGGLPRYASCQTGSFDLFLPFIERGLELLNSNGRLGYIAPSLWRYNEYGAGLRKLLHSGGHLDRWIDFGSFQVFDEALIYTALQFYSRVSNDRVRFALAPTGELTRIHDWDDPSWYVNYKELPKEEPWIFVSREEKSLLAKLAKQCARLESSTVTTNIFQGLITSADHIYQLERIGKNKYLYFPQKKEGESKRPDPVEVPIEDEIMHPLVSGAEAHRYEVPKTSNYILFPFKMVENEMRLMPESELKTQYPHAWSHLKRFEKKLRSRENNGFDDDEWYRFGRYQNLDKQETKKLIVAQTVNRMSVCPDEKGQFYLNNVRVNGIILTKPDEFWFLQGILNSAVADWVFRRIAKPKGGGYFEANRQFIAPLPIPKANNAYVKRVERQSKALTTLYSARRDILEEIDRRFNSCELETYPEEDLWPKLVHSVSWHRAKAADHLNSKERTAWARAERQKEISKANDILAATLKPGVKLLAEFRKGELKLLADDFAAIDGVFVEDEWGEKAVLWWNQVLRTNRPVGEFDAQGFANSLRSLRIPATKALANQLRKLDAELHQLEEQIAKSEADLENITHKLYALTEAESAMVKRT